MATVENSYNLITIMKDISQNFSCGNAVPTQFLMWERRSHAFPPHYTTGQTYNIALESRIHENYMLINQHSSE